MINRRNVVTDVSKNVDACKRFFYLEIEARVIACFLQVLGVESMDEEPSTDILPVKIKDGTNSVKKKYLMDTCSKVVDIYILQMQQIEARLRKQKYADWLASTNHKNKDGRFECRETGCKETFACNGKKRLQHEKTHGLHQVTKDDVNPFEDDDMFCYQLSFLEYGMIVLNFYDAISEGDGARIIRCWKFMLPHLQKDGSRSRKYALEGLYILCQIQAVLSEQSAHSLIWNRFHKAKTSYGGNIPLDLMLEHYNNAMKSVIRQLGPNNTNKKAVDRYAKAITINMELLDNFDHECRVIRRSGKHSKTASLKTDLQKIITALSSEAALQYKKGRKYKYFSGVKASLLEDFNIHNMYSWIETHKKNLAINRGQR